MNASQNPIQILGYQISLNKSPLSRVLPPLKTGEVRSAGQVLQHRAHTSACRRKLGEPYSWLKWKSVNRGKQTHRQEQAFYFFILSNLYIMISNLISKETKLGGEF